MNHQLDISEKTGKWYETFNQVSREIILPLSLPEAMHRFKTAFISPIVISNGFFGAKYVYSGEATSTAIEVEFSVKGRSRINYTMHGTLSPYARGSKLTMTVSLKNPFLFFIGPLVFILIQFYKQEATYAMFMFFMPFLAYLAMFWHLNDAANNVAGLVEKIMKSKDSTFI